MTIQTKFRDLTAVSSALQELGCAGTVEPDKVSIHLSGQELQSLRGISWTPGRGLTFVLDKKRKVIHVTGDDMMINQLERKGVMNQLRQFYAKHKILKDAKRHGYSVKVHTRKDGKFLLVAKKAQLVSHVRR